MKIEGLTGVHTTIQSCSPRGGGESGGEFAEILARAVGQQPQGVEAAGLGEVGGVEGVGRAVVSMRLGALLSALDDYARGLGDTRLTLKQLQPLVTRLQEEAEALDEALSAHRVDDALGAMAREGLVHARAEIIKFWRGEYV